MNKNVVKIALIIIAVLVVVPVLVAVLGPGLSGLWR